MASLKLVYSAVKGELGEALVAMQEPIARAAAGAIKDAASEVKTKGRAEIARGGFGTKWQNALRTTIYPSKFHPGYPYVLAYHKIPYANVFQTGARIAGKPMLWIPLTGSPARIAGRRFTPKAFRELIGPLVTIQPRRAGGRPFLASPISGRPTSKISVARFRRGQAGLGRNISLQFVFVGIPVVNLRQRFDLVSVFNRAQAGLAEGYLRNLKA